MNKADLIAAALKAKGYNVVWREETDAQVVVGIDFVNNKETPWIRAFHLDKEAGDVLAFIREIEDWKKGVRMDMHLNTPSATVQSVIQHYGLARTYQALREVHV